MEIIKTTPDSGLGIYSQAHKITTRAEWRQAKAIVAEMCAWLDEKNGKFEGNHDRAWAIAHSQVCGKPFRMFIVTEDLTKKGEEGMSDVNAIFCARAIYNPEILEKPLKSVSKIPTREVVDGKVVLSVMEKELYNIVNVPEGCMSFPHRTAKTVGRFFRIKVRYQYEGMFGFMRTKTEWIEGLKAHIFQHEVDHMNGENIFFKKPS